MTISPNIVYAIKVNGNEREILRVFRILFAHGYVFNRDERIRTMKLFQKEYNTIGRYDRFYYWRWIVLNYDKECKAVVTVFDSFLGDFVEATIEDLFDAAA